jgi:hypothetical protein
LQPPEKLASHNRYDNDYERTGYDLRIVSEGQALHNAKTQPAEANERRKDNGRHHLNKGDAHSANY